MMKLKALLLKRGMTQEDFARRVGISKQHANALINEREYGTIKTYKKIADTLGVRISKLFE